jgi:hypothetical protein
MVYSFLGGFFERTPAVFGVRAGVAFDAPTSPGTVDTAAGELTVAAGTSWLEKVELEIEK